MKQFLIFTVAAVFIACNQTKKDQETSKPEIHNPALDSVQSEINTVLDYHTAASNNYDGLEKNRFG
ncbi:MAG: hypothetical protein HZB42_12335 [Sphingobacteriales bacterium]|nr:hypothetical protein [Sphingobacteriales bacterium]